MNWKYSISQSPVKYLNLILSDNYISLHVSKNGTTWLTEQAESCVETKTYALQVEGNLTLVKEKIFGKHFTSFS